jgi:two-component system, response regulator RegA
MPRSCVREVGSGRPASVVLVVDNKPTLGSLGEYLDAEGYIVHHARSLEEADLLLDLIRPDFAVTELRVGPRCGLEFLDMVRARNSSCRAVVATAHNSVGTAQEAIRRGAHYVLSKPLCGPLLLAAFGERRLKDVTSQEAALEAIKMSYIEELMSAYGTISRTADALGVDRRSLRRMLTRFGPLASPDSAIARWWNAHEGASTEAPLAQAAGSDVHAR